MSDQSATSHLQVLFEAALQDYEKKTGIALAKHPLADRLQNFDSVDSVTAVLHEQTQAFSQFREKDKVLKPLKKAISVLCKLSATASIGRDIGLHFPPVTAIHTGLALLLSAVNGTTDSYDALADLLESIEHFLNRLDIYTKIPPTAAMTEMVVKILIELLFTLALATKQIKEGKPKKLVKKLLGEKDVEAILQRLDRLTQDEARITAVQTLEVVHGLFEIMRSVMDDGEASVGHLRDTLKIMQQLASDQKKSERQSIFNVAKADWDHRDCLQNHHIACESRHPGSAAWFIQSNTFSEWKTFEAPSPLLWIHGKPGAGKSVFCSTIIEDVDDMRKAGLASLAYFYCDFRERGKTGLRGLLSSLLVQLCHQSNAYYDVLFKFYSKHTNGLSHPSDNALVGCLKDLIYIPGLAPMYLIVDGLDECPKTSDIPSPRSKVLTLIEELIKLRFPNLRICVTSRPETDIEHVLGRLNPHNISLHGETGQQRDIEDYIKSVINTHPENISWKEEHKQLVVNDLTKKSDGMFKWVQCQAVNICGCIPAKIQHTLANLPKTLDETYERTLREIKEANWEFAYRLFQFVLVASRPLRVEELSELLAFDFDAKPIPKFHEDWRLQDPVHAVLSTCSSLLAIVDLIYPGRVIQFSHYSVKEYLTSTRLSEQSDIISRRYHVSMTPAHTLAAQACLGILLHLDNDVVTNNNAENWPLSEYAARHWADHALFEGVWQKVQVGVKQLFDPRKQHLAICIWIHDPDVMPWNLVRQAGNPWPPLGTPLHYAARLGLHVIVKFLIIERSQDVHSRRFTGNATPLHLASAHGHMKATRMLIEHGADVSARNKNGQTPLHLASRNGEAKVARMLIERGAGVAAQNKRGETPLHVASKTGQAEAARILVERGADMATQNKRGETPLCLALTLLSLFSKMGQVEVARMLIERGADVVDQSKVGKTPLHLASEYGEVEVARMLIERGADVAAQNKRRETPLHIASRNGHVEVARMLVEHGADLAAKNEHGETPLHLASRDGRAEVVRMLIERGADVAAQNKHGETPLHRASRPDYDPYPNYILIQGLEEVSRILLEQGADVNALNKDGFTPLRLVSKSRFVRDGRAQVLLQHGAESDDESGEDLFSGIFDSDADAD